MTLRFVDSFDHYVTADITEKWNSSTGSFAISASNGRRSTASFRASSAPQHVTKTIDAQATWIVGVALKVSAIAGGAQPIIQLLDAGTLQCDVRINADGTLSVTRNATVLGTSTFAISAGVFYYIEFKCLINDTTGTAEIKVDGSSKLALTSQDTKSTANASANQIRVGSVLQSGTYDFDDLYICDGAGSAPWNTFLGDCRADYFPPIGNGNSSQLDGSDGNQVDSYLLVDDASPDDDTTYVQTSTAGNKDTYAHADMTHTPTSIFGVQQFASAKKDDAGSRSIANVTRSGGTDFDGATQALASSYAYYMDIKEVDPNTSAAWTKTNLNAAEFGVKCAA